jgi:glycosyltransferase involved in cell wall biosynthesis
MRIGIDMQVVGRQRTGDETYIKNLVRRYAALRPGHDYHLYYTHAEGEPWLRSLEGPFHLHRLPVKNPFFRVPFSYPWRAWRDRLDVFQTSYVGVTPPGVKLVLAVHDLTWEFFPETFPADRALFLKLTRWSVKRASAVLVCSENTKKDLMRLYGAPAEKIHVIYNGVDPSFTPCGDQDRMKKVKEKYGIKRPYFLSVGALQPRKNLKRLVEAFIEARKNPGFDYDLVLVGKKAWGDQPGQDRPDILRTGYVGEDELPVLYAGATAFAYMSLYEGFGLPPIEAMACGAPVVVSNTSSFPESCGDVAVYADPQSVPDIARALLEMGTQPALRESLRAKGLERVKRFTWDLPVRQTMAAYEAAAGLS